MNDTNTQTQKKRRQGVRLPVAERDAAQARFFEVYGQTANVSLACRAAGINRATYYYWKEKDNGHFLERLAVADQEADEALEAELHRRAVIGVQEPVFYQGKIVGHVPKLSDNLLMFRMKKRMPEYRDGPQAVAQAVTQNLIQVGDAPPKAIDDMTEEELAVAIPQLEAEVGEE